jgi:hypothetical protein
MEVQKTNRISQEIGEVSQVLNHFYRTGWLQNPFNFFKKPCTFFLIPYFMGSKYQEDSIN